MTSVRTHSADDVAKYILVKCEQDQIAVTNKKLQKLLYYTQAWSLVFLDKPLFKDKIEAWVHGPTVARIYGKFKKFGSDAINISIDTSIKDKFAANELHIMREVLKVYAKFDADYLEALSHSEQPWQEARAGLEKWDSSKNEINLETMKNYYTKKNAAAHK